MSPLRLTRFLATAAMLAAVVPVSTVVAQSILLRTGTPGGRIQVSPGARVGIPVVIDMGAAAGGNLASLTTGMDFGTARLTLDSVRAGAFGTLTANTTNAASGSITLGVFDARGTTVTASIATAWFTASATAGGTTIVFSPTVAGSDVGTNILAQLRVRNLDVCVAPSGKWGDVTGDSAVNIIDAQQIARATVGLSVLSTALVAAQGDVNADGAVNIIDAQQIARFSVGLSAATLINTLRFIPPTIASVTLSGLPTGIVPVGASAQLVATPKDAASVAQSGCVPTTWATSNAAIATVDSGGRVVGVANGTATITATAGGQSASGTITVSVPAGAPAVMAITSGNNQYIVTGRNGGPFLEVKVTDAANIPVPGVAVLFTPGAGGGSLRTSATSQSAASLTATTDANGLARAIWVGGSLTSDPQVFSTTRTLVASATGLAPVTFTSTVLSGEVTTGACVRTAAAAAYCWGDFTARILHPTLSDSTTGAYPELVAGAQLASFSSLIYSYSTCGLTATGAAYCWGWNSAGELGNGTRTASTTWVPVSGSLIFSSVSSGWHQACGVTTGNVAYCWGLNSLGQLGNGQLGTSETAPVQVSGNLSWSSVATGGTSTCGVTTAGALYCWGTGFVTDVTGSLAFPAPVRIGTGSSYTQVTVGSSSACALTTTGHIECWGANTQGVFGDGTSGTAPRIDPAPVSGSTVFNRVVAAGSYACGGTSTGVLYCWGGNGQGNLGTGDLFPRTAPTQIAADATGPITLNLFGGCYVAATGQPWCWGAFGSGEGVGPYSTVQRRLSPVPVRWVEGTAGQPRTVVATTLLVTSAVAGAGVTPLPTVRVRDYANAPVAGASVTFALSGGSATLSGASATTDANGIATIGGISTTSASVATALALRADVAGAGSVAFTINLTAAPATVTVISGDSVWTGGFNSSWLVPQVLRVTDGANNPIPNVSVVFTPDVSGGTLSAGVTSFGTSTDADGRATLPGGTWQPNFSEGVVSKLNAVVSGYATPVTFSAYRGQSNTATTSCELTAAGAAYCMGNNFRGTVGDGTTTTRSSAVAVSGSHVFSALAEGIALHKCGLVAGAAYCWGYNGAGQLGDGTTTDRNTPVAVTGGLSFTSLVTQGNTTCGLTSANLVYCWGWSGTAGWGDAEATRGRIRLAPTLVNLGGQIFTKISLLDDGLCGLTSAGAIYCRGNGSRGINGDGTNTQRTTFTQWTGGPWSDISAGPITACALDAGGLAWCVGNESQGSLGDGVTSGFTQFTPIQTLGGITFQSIHTAYLGGCARRPTFEVYCWGFNSAGQAGVGSTTPVPQPTRIPGFTFTSLRQTGYQTACGKVTNGLLYCWGQNGSGQVGDGTFLSPRPSPVAVVNWPEGPAAGVAVSFAAATSLSPAGSVGTAVTPTPAVSVRDRLGAGVAGVVVTFSVATGNGTVTGATATTDANGLATAGSWMLPATLGTAQLTASATGFTTVTFNANVVPAAASFTITGGNNQFSPDYEGSLQALSVTVRDASNQPISGLPVTWTVTAGNGTVSGGTSTVTTTSSTGIASMFAWNPPAAINTAYTLTASVSGQSPVTFTAQRLPWGANGVDNPSSATCRLTTAGAAYCWGGNAQGAVGDGSTTPRTAPVPVTGGLVFASLAHGPFNFHMCGLTSAGQAYCWGNNVAGQLGDSTRTNRTSPVAVRGGLTFTSLYTGPFETCGLVAGGAMYCWGWGSWSHRGDGEIYTVRSVPAPVSTNGHTFTTLALGLRSICAVDGGQQAFCWGLNFGGQLGTGNTTPQTIPVATSTPLKFTQLTAGFDHTCGVTTGSTVACWGANTNGVVGNGTTTNQLTPLVVSGITGASAVWSGESHNCALASTTVWCWGSNSSGQVGDGTNVSPRTSPVVTAAGITPTGLVSFSRSLSCASTSVQLYCWGGQNGGVGDGNGANRFVPTAVQWPEASPTAPATIVSTFPSAATGGTSAPQNITVQVKSAVGAALPGVPVSFVVTSGGGSVSVATVNTDASGNAGTAWTLAGSTGTVGTMEARVTEVPSLKFTATIASVAGSIAITGGNNQYIPDFQSNTQPLSVTVLDASNNPIIGATVTWTVTAANGTVATTAINTTTGGIATQSGWTPPSSIGQTYTLTASVPGLAPVTFTASRIAWSANSAANPTSSLCRLTTAGAAYCWGGNAKGAVGDGSNTERTVPTAVSGGVVFASLAKGPFGFHNCGLTSAGQAYCWGDNETGQLGNNSQTNSNVPVAVAGGLTFSALATGPLSSCGLTTAGAMYCWGWGGYSFRGDNELYTIRTTPTAVTTGGPVFTSIAVGLRGICGLDASGQAYCWGENIGGVVGSGNFSPLARPAATATSLRFASVAVGRIHACGVTTTGSVACWGSNGSGEVGIGNTTNQPTPTVVGGVSGALEVRIGESHSCARTSTNVFCWGANFGGQVGDGTTVSPRSVPVQVVTGITPVSLASFAQGASCVSSSSQLYCWGSTAGGIGDGVFAFRSAPTAVQWPEASTSVAATLVTTIPQSITVSAGAPQSVTVQVRNSLGVVVPNTAVSFVVTSGGGAVSAATVTSDASGNASTAWTLAGAIGTAGTMEARVTDVPSLTFTGTIASVAGSISITGGNNQYIPDFTNTSAQPLSVTVLDASNVPVVGATVTWTLTSGNGTVSPSATNTTTGGIATLYGWVPPTAVGTSYTLQASVSGLPPVTFTARRLAYFNNGSSNPNASICRLNSAGAAYCWGANEHGQVGDATSTNRTSPTAVSGSQAFSSLAKGSFGYHNCALTSSGQAYCWGDNDAGQLGNNTQVMSNVPVLVSGGLTFSSLNTGPLSTCGLTTAGAMYCWGWGGYSFRGDGEIYGIRTVPTVVNTAGHTFTSIGVGVRATCGLDAAGQAFCWGENGGNLGTGNFTASTTPVATSTSLRFSSLSEGSDHTCALTTGNTVACWGNNYNGAIGNGTTTTQTTPLEVAGITGALDVRSGDGHNCARTSTSIYCWGANYSGQVGDGTTISPRLSPILVGSGMTPTSLLSFARSASCATSGSQMYCWGWTNGGIGDGTGQARTVPTAVRWPESTPGSAALIAAVTPNAVNAPAASPQTVTVAVRDAFGAAVSGVTVNFVVTAGGGSVTPASAVTDASGNASTAWSLAGATGTVGGLQARVSGLPTLNITSTVVTPSTILITGGNNQALPDHFNNAGNLSVTVRDANNAPIPNFSVTWNASSGNGTVSGAASAITLTNSAGVASLNYTWTVPRAAGVSYTLQAGATGLTPVTFTATRLALGDATNASILPMSSVCRLNTAGAAFCWGGNLQGQVGDGSNASRGIPTAVSGGLTFSSLARGPFGHHQCALTSSGLAYCWGDNNAGQLGNNSLTDSSVPVAVSGGLTFASLATGSFSTCGITTSSALYCWGWGGFSYRGDNEFYSVRTVPTAVNTAGHTFQSVSLGLSNICGLESGQAFCWGENFSGQLGIGTTNSAITAQATSTTLRFAQLATGWDHTCGTTTSGGVACWGANGSGQIGNGTTSTQLTPLALSIPGTVAEILSGESHNCARTSQNVYCWGSNWGGQVGDGTNVTPRPTPLMVGSGMTPTGLPASARSTSCASTASQLYCWGGVGQGQTGNNTLVTALRPTAARWPEASASSPATITPITALNVSAAAGVGQTVTVQIQSATGLPLANVTVTFVVTTGGGSVSAATGTTDASGNVSTSWTLAGTSGTVGTLEARVANVPSVVFTGTVTSPLATITVSPNPVTTAIGTTQQFTAAGRDAGGTAVAITPVWSVVNGGGSISASGLFTDGGVAGTFANTVKATSGTIFGTATVTVTAPAPYIDLGTAALNGIMAGTAVTCSGSTSTINADVSISPGLTISGPCLVTGVSHLADAVAIQNQVDLAAAYSAAAGKPCPGSNGITTDLGGTTKLAGVYCSSAGIGLTGALTLDGQGNSNATFLFQAANSLTVAGNVVLTGGAQAKNVYFLVGGSATLGSGSQFQGNILALTSITLATGTTLTGRALARNGAVSASAGSVITLP